MAQTTKLVIEFNTFIEPFLLFFRMRYGILGVSILCIALTSLSFTIFAQVEGSLMSQTAFAQDSTEPQQEREFIANLSGQAEIPPVMTNASGEATLTLNEDGDEVSYELDVQDIEGALAAHIHWGNPSRTGPIFLTLYNATEPTEDIDGSLTDGDFTSEDFESRLPGESSTSQTLGQNMSSLIDLMEQEKTYVDVHTDTHPTGELRGTIEEVQDEAVEENNNGDDEDNE